MIVARNLGEKRRVIGLRVQRAWQPRHRRAGTQMRMRRKGRRAPVVEQLEGMPKAYLVVMLDELDGVAGLAAGHAMPQTLARRDDEVGLLAIRVERTKPDPVLAAVRLHLHAAAAHQGQQVGLAFHTLDFRFRNTGHGVFSGVLSAAGGLNQSPRCGSVSTGNGTPVRLFRPAAAIRQERGCRPLVFQEGVKSEVAKKRLDFNLAMCYQYS